MIVLLYNSGGSVIAASVTSGAGTYSFASFNLPALVPSGTYSVGIVLPGTLQPTLSYVGSTMPTATDRYVCVYVCMYDVCGVCGSVGILQPGSTSDVRSNPFTAPAVGRYV